jgi:hypothetical protein
MDTFRIVALLVFLLFAGNADGVQVEEWNRTYRDVGIIFDVLQTRDEGFILAAGDELIKTDAYGSERWIRKFNRPELASREFIQLLKIELTSDGGYILAGSKSLTGDYGAKDVAFVIKTDSYGNEQWNRTFDEDIEKFYLIRGGADSVQQTSDGGYILAEISSRDNCSYARVIKMDPNGNIEWIRKFEKTSLEGASVLQTLDSGYLLATSKVYENNPDFDAWLIKLDTKGNKQWERTFGGKSWDVISSILLTSDGFILAGKTHSYGSSDALLIKTDTNGNVMWSKTFAGTNSGGFLSVQKTRDGGYILAGYTGADLGSDLMESFYGDAWLVKVDADGTKQWELIFEEHWGMFFYSARQTKDGGYIIAGCCGWLAKLSGNNISLLAGSAGAAPPPALLDINGNGQISEIGSYCWSEGDRGTCADYIDIQTPKEPLITSPTYTAHLSLPLQEPPEDVQINIIRVTDEDELKEGTNRTRSWLFKDGNYTRLPAESETDINLSLEPGLYVLNVMARWKDKGSASYGFLLEAQIAKEREPLILTVDKSGGTNYTRIQDAIDNASDGDTILVYSGTYYESVNVDKKLVLETQSPTTTGILQKHPVPT